MSHEPPVPDANQSPYPLTEQPHPDEATLAALKAASSGAGASASDTVDNGAGSKIDRLVGNARDSAESAIDKARDGLGEAAERAGEFGEAARDKVGSWTRTAGDTVGGSRNLLGIGAVVGAGVLALAGWALSSRGDKAGTGTRRKTASATPKRSTTGRTRTASKPAPKATGKTSSTSGKS